MEQGFGVVIVAAGRGSRMGAAESKQYLPLLDKPVIIHTLERFQMMPACEAIVWVVSAEDTARCAAWQEEYGLDKVRAIVAGGAERQHSVYAGLQAVRAQGLDYVLIHDGVRPFVETDSAEACYRAAREHGAAVLAVPVKDTIKQVNGGVITATPDRRSLWAIQTPQAFRLADVMAAHEQAAADGFIGTDDAMLVERAGMQVRIVEGEYTNVKLTTPDDLEWASWWLARRAGRPGEQR
ncbi:2-C-methyl-D-erythritol 4-phosphate cytidylyltransferase [Paenibacillus dendritiformis]|uniref:2-C-methyl-D-erythritol 4-phosphate cytidylyltransferase n=1 Tax=Paenibacillus dendritiformis C454 TaxID=1131935 RepID=H3SEJ4_9BACL|nr:2-C-methyl-D-erythritol 4-phosphate cytidylyltransferase [Paenibacillus dendritiformis]EHQ62442.1 2-C-methyl-D-erythritol 4-phosphate cytidylyltransferase [Paenibacillus dendritiformis C454]CAH8773240.1 2-C-methyl-D-erythritol 4-phosphate cytidylyltransferase [Paenibacillus dendritiformis]